MKTIENLCIALSLRDDDRYVLRYGATLVERGIAKRVCFVHVTPSAESGDPHAEVEALKAQVQQSIGDEFRPSLTPEDRSVTVLIGPREDRLLEFLQTKGAELILLGHNARASSGKRSLARRLAMASAASVWMVPDSSSDTISKVLAPVDFSLHSADSLSIATGIAQQAGLAECTALHVYYDPSVHRFDDHHSVSRGQEAVALENFIQSTRTYGVNIVGLLEEGSNVARTILRIATEQNFDLIVLNTRGRSRAASILLGSETSQVIMEANVPVLAIKHQGAQLKFLQALASPEIWRAPNQETN
jgi:SulP family sulfate permease